MRILHIAALSLRFFNTLPKGALMVEVCIGIMALQNLQQYGCQTGNKLKEKSRDLYRNSSRFFFQIKNETMFGSGYVNCPEFGVLGGVIFKLDICKQEDYCSSGAFQVAPA